MTSKKEQVWRRQDSSKTKEHSANKIHFHQELRSETDRCAELPREYTREREQNLCMSTHEAYEKIAVMIGSGASETVASVEKFESYPIEKTPAPGTTHSSAAGKQTEDIVNAGQRYIGAVDDHGTESQSHVPDVQRTWSRRDIMKRQQVGGIWTLCAAQNSFLWPQRAHGNKTGTYFFNMWVVRRPRE